MYAQGMVGYNQAEFSDISWNLGKELVLETDVKFIYFGSKKKHRKKNLISLAHGLNIANKGVHDQRILIIHKLGLQ